MSRGGSAAGSQAQRAKPSAAAVSQLAQRGEPSWPAVDDEVEADCSGEGKWFDGRVTQARADGTARLSAKAVKAAQEAEAQEEGSEAAAAEEREGEQVAREGPAGWVPGGHGPVAGLHPKEAAADERSGLSRGG